MSLIVYLNAPGKVPGLGHEFGEPVHNGIARFDNRYGSTRYVYYVNGKAEGYALKLLQRAREEHGVSVHSRHLTKQGKKWADKVKENPIITTPQWIAIGAIGVSAIWAINRVYTIYTTLNGIQQRLQNPQNTNGS